MSRKINFLFNIHTMPKQTLITTLPSLFIGILFYCFLGYRTDYLGHYAAGFGGTLIAIAIILQIIPKKQFNQFSYSATMVITLFCIFLGVITESTIFKIAKFDEVDFCNQSLGAIFAALGLLTSIKENKPKETFFILSIINGIITLIIGFYFAFK